ncbi:putative outer membrane starch-binding protein [Algoriphagus ratkowskyi]|uniref:Putative outer membrane starch-binding protein n=1 Tax=Algoriphagus ratkowskyi TaxID=57028 RepID=A0A2W7RN24_9BACT|nr:RagB/SusD family nutrient uptake outer membrane protein [Algoriphagus ratkowskyi]PZX52135.1 putative outer membrane starch-binding protein [Algoriphagus ratkowskyi]TXD76103.1 RagB/SusD family nutrient uptake outer membrane protein [Algoriphagus ratkowskyi]
MKILTHKFRTFCCTAAIVAIAASCSSDYLEEVPYGEVAPSEMNTPTNVERAIIAAYSVLNGQFDGASSAFNSPASNWSFGDVVSDDAYKGGGGTGDQSQIHQMEIFGTLPTTTDVQRKWLALYEGIKRVNYALNLLEGSKTFDGSLRTQREGELRFLRGHYYFELKKIYNRIPYIDETAKAIDDFYVSNTVLSDEELWGKIEADFEAAYDVLPADQTASGRPAKLAAKAYLAKTYVFQQKWAEALAASNEVINSGKYSLLPNFRDVFLPDFDNSSEIIFAVQHSVNDGEPSNFNGSIGDRLSAPGGPFYNQYGFHRPSQNLIDSYQTLSDGTPNFNPSANPSTLMDPRVDHTVGRPGIPYLDLKINYESTWARDLATYGPYAPKKRMVSALSSLQIKTWPYISALNYYVIRYADLLLWKAEAQVELGDLEGARATVNIVRERAATSATVLALGSDAPASDYAIASYSSAWTDVAAARTAVRLERRVELAMEGHRFFDLVRWGVAAEVMNSYFNNEKKFRSHLTNASFKVGVNEYFPIPQAYIDLVGNELVKQNSGY